MFKISPKHLKNGVINGVNFWHQVTISTSLSRKRGSSILVFDHWRLLDALWGSITPANTSTSRAWYYSFQIYSSNLCIVYKHSSLTQVPLKRPLIPPIFLTIWANLVYWDSSSLTAVLETPAPRATLVTLDGCRENNLAPSWLSSSE